MNDNNWCSHLDKKDSYLIVEMFLFERQANVHGVKRSSSAWQLTSVRVHAASIYSVRMMSSLFFLLGFHFVLME